MKEFGMSGGFLDSPIPFREAFFQAVEHNPYLTFVFFDSRKKIVAANALARQRSLVLFNVVIQPGMDARDILPREEWAEFDKYYLEALNGTSTNRERSIPDAKGNEHWIELSYFPIREEGGVIAGVCMTSYDINRLKKITRELSDARALLSEKVERRDLQLQDHILRLNGEVRERQAAEERLRKSEQFFRSIFERSGVGMNILDLDGIIHQTNPFFETMLGYTPMDLSGRDFSTLIHPLDREAWCEEFRKMPSGDPSHLHFEKRLLRADGETVWVNATATFIQEAVPDGGRILCIMENISERMTLEDKLIRSERLAAVGTLAGGVAHEFNNINMGILGFTELSLEQEGLPQVVREYLGKIRQNVMRANGVTGNLLAFSQPGSKEKTPEPLAELVEEALSLASPQLVKDHITVVKNFSEIPKVSVDRGAVVQVFLNLIINAVHALIGRPQKHLTFTTGVVEKNFARVSVMDTGCGIPESSLKQIFIPFFSTKGGHARGSNQSLVKGTGLGLSVCHSIVNAHRGEIRVESVENVGSTFTILLPL